jgi:hypothetical protein
MSAEELDKKIHKTQKSTKTLIKHLTPVHHLMRQRSRWYYKWHLRSYYRLCHFLLMGIFIFVVSFQLVRAFSSSAQPFNNNPSVNQEENYNPEKEKEEIRKVILAYYQGYIDQNPEKITACTTEPLSTWEKEQAKSFKAHDRNLKPQGDVTITLKDIDIPIENYNLDIQNAEVKVKRIIEIKNSQRLGESSNLETKMKLKKTEDGSWKIYDRTYCDMWVSIVY